MTQQQQTMLKTRLERLPHETRDDLYRAYERHKRACERHGMRPDPLWWLDALVEAERFPQDVAELM